MNKKILFLLCLISFHFMAFAQENFDRVEIRKNGYQTELEKKDLQNRELQSEAFFKLTQFVSLPSTFSFLGTDYHQVINKGLNKKPFILNADIRTPIFIGGKRGYWMEKGKQRFHALHVIPRFRVRILNDDLLGFNDTSLPVRTPSYLPGIKYYTSSSKSFNKDNQKSGWLSLSIYHHSNGNYNDELFTEKFLSNNDFSTTPYKVGEINTFDGNFSELLVFEIGKGFIKEGKYEIKHDWFHYNRYLRQKNKAEIGGKSRPIFSWSEMQRKDVFSEWIYELHPKPLSNKVLLCDNLLARNILHFQRSESNIIQKIKAVKNGNKYERYPDVEMENSRFSIDISYILDLNYNSVNPSFLPPSKIPFLDLPKRLNIVATKYFRMPGTENSAFFIQSGYLGSDTYNVYFAQSAFILRGGIAFVNFKKSNSLNKAL